MRADRLRECMALKGVSQAELARRANVSPAAIQQLLNGSSKTTRSLRTIAAALEVNPDWLEGLEGATPIVGLKVASFSNDRETVDVPYLGVFEGRSWERVQVGIRSLTLSSYWFADITDGLGPSDVSFCKLSTDEMSPTLSRGDDVCYRHSREHDGRPDGIWFLEYNEAALLRRVRSLRSGKYHLSADNPVIAPFEAEGQEIDFWGKVIWQGRSLAA
ncbi:XRE family transcriptional regulator [Sphingomonas sp. R86521]|uniref:XRE family transcriptional regulator n=1 Tax=Sphingomonas sp. R86521 TaxID=3093860 RepID=UPI0036D3BF72